MMSKDNQMQGQLGRWMKTVESEMTTALSRRIPGAFNLIDVEIRPDELSNRYLYPLTESSMWGFHIIIVAHVLLDGEDYTSASHTIYDHYASHKKGIVGQIVSELSRLLDKQESGG